MTTTDIHRVFRSINLRVADLGDSHETLSLICECGHITCFRVLEVRAAEFDSVRQTPGALIVWREHVSEAMALVSDSGESCVVHVDGARVLAAV